MEDEQPTTEGETTEPTQPETAATGETTDVTEPTQDETPRTEDVTEPTEDVTEPPTEDATRTEEGMDVTEPTQDDATREGEGTEVTEPTTAGEGETTDVTEPVQDDTAREPTEATTVEETETGGEGTEVEEERSPPASPPAPTPAPAARAAPAPAPAPAPESRKEVEEKAMKLEAAAASFPSAEQKRAPSADSQGRPYRPEAGQASPTSLGGDEARKSPRTPAVPEAPHLPFPERQLTQDGKEGTMTNCALNIIWSFGVNRNVPVLNLTDGFRKAIMYACGHVGIMYDFQNNKQFVLQGHLNPIACTCISDDKRWLVTGEKGPDAMVNIWDTYTGVPIQTLFDPNPEGGAVAVALTPDARYLATLSAGTPQMMAIWDWTLDGETPLCSAELNASYGQQNYISFSREDIRHLVTNSETQVIFYKWVYNKKKEEDRMIQFYAPPLTDEDFNKPVGRYSQSIYLLQSSRAITATSIGNLVVWDNNRPLTKVVSLEQSADKKALKIIKAGERGISVLTATDKLIVCGDHGGHIKFFDQSLKLVYWYQDIHFGPITSVSFAADPSFLGYAREGTEFPNDATIPEPKFVVRDFVVGSSLAIIGNVTTNGSRVQIIQREHDSSVHALAPHPRLPLLAIGSYSGLLKIWNYDKKQVIASRHFDRSHLQSCAFDPKGQYLVVGFTNGVTRVLDSLTLKDEMETPFHFAKESITQIVFSHDCRFFATADADYTTSLFKVQPQDNKEPFLYLGRYRAHYKPIKDLLFGVHLDSNKPRLLSVGEDRVMVEYDLEQTVKDQIVLSSSDRIEQSGVPCCMAWYPPVTKEHFIVTANDQFKLKLYNATTKMCRKTLLGPTYGSPLKKMLMVPIQGIEHKDHRYGAYITDDKVGLIIMPLDGNPHNAMALIAHSSGVGNLVASSDGKYLFTAGGHDATVHMWEINTDALEAQATLGGDNLIPFYGLLEGGREGELFAELEDYFYYAQIRSQGVNATEDRAVSTTIPLAEIPFVMRALGFYPTEQEIEDMLNEVKFSRYVETGQYVEEIDLGTFIKLYVNHRPAFGLPPEKLQWAFDVLGVPSRAGGVLERGELLDLVQSKGEHMTEYELAEYLTTLLGFNPEGGSSELHELDTQVAGDVIDRHMPTEITASIFAREILGFDVPQSSE